MDEIDPGSLAKTPPVPRKRPLLFYLMAALSVSLVTGTVLLSNDMRHLRRLLKATDQEWLIAGLQQPPARPVVKPQPHPKPQEPPKAIAINPRLWKQPEPALAVALRRQWPMTGPDMCKNLRQSGAEMSEWQPAAIGANIFECSYDKIYAKNGDRITSSLFLIVRGNALGKISNMRVKLLAPPKDADGKLDPQLVKIFETMLTQTRWEDFEEQLGAIRDFKDIRKDGFGASMSFTREGGDAQSFNFLLSLQAKTAEQRRLNDLFRADNGFDLPQPPPAAPMAMPEAPGPAHSEAGRAMPPEPPMPMPEPTPMPSAPDDGANAAGDPAPETLRIERTRPVLRERGSLVPNVGSRLRIPHGPSER